MMEVARSRHGRRKKKITISKGRHRLSFRDISSFNIALRQRRKGNKTKWILKTQNRLLILTPDAYDSNKQSRTHAIATGVKDSYTPKRIKYYANLLY